jgi:hypothetical protein
MVAIGRRRVVIDGRGKAHEFFFELIPTPTAYAGPQAKAGFVIKGIEKNFLLKSLRSLSQKLDSKY